MSALRVDSVAVSFDGVAVLAGFELDLAEGERLAVLGPSGSGKTTLLRVIAGLQSPDAGRVLLGGRDVTGKPAHQRGVGLMFQDGVLFPHRDVKGNVGFGLRMEGVTGATRDARVADVLELVGLAGYERRSGATRSV